MQDSLGLAFIHPRLKQGDLAHNHARLLELNRRAAKHGADLLINTELGLSGYSFQDRGEMAPCAVPGSSSSIAAMADLAREQGVWICLGHAEREPWSGIFYNSAVLLDSGGKPVALRRKVTAEPRWACPGPPSQDDTCDSPWGRLGLLICSESYFSLLPRVQALKGADLLLVPANWPANGLDPREIWRARTLENGFALAACNRSGKESGIDFSNAPSCLLDHRGSEIPLEQIDDEIWFAKLPLKSGLLPNQRAQRLKGRKPGDYHPLYAYLRQAQENMGGYYDLPGPGKLRVHCLPSDGNGLAENLPGTIQAAQKAGRDIFLLPCLPEAAGETAPELLSRLAKKHHAAFMAGLKKTGSDPALLFIDEKGKPRPEATEGAKAFCLLDWGPARLGLALAEDLAHPEAAAAMAKQGCDLALACGGDEWPGAKEVLAAKSLERLAVAAVLPEMGIACLPPEGHERWAEATAEPGEMCSLDLDTRPLRKKFFMDRIDYQRLFSRAEKDRKTK